MSSRKELPAEVEVWIRELRGDCDLEGLKEVIRRAVDDDDEWDAKTTDDLLSRYLRATPNERKFIDITLVTLTGWTLRNLLSYTCAPKAAREAFEQAVVDTGGSDF